MSDIVERLRHHIAIRGGPAKDDDGKYIGTTWPMMLDAADEIERLREAAADLQQTFDLQWAADMRAVKRWREAHPGNDLVLPDRANMVVWLMEQHAALAATPVGGEREALQKAIDSAFSEWGLHIYWQLRNAVVDKIIATCSPQEQPAIHQGNQHGRQG